MLAVSSVYIAHYSPLSERRALLEKQLSEYDISGVWFEEEPTNQEVEEIYNPSCRDWDNKVAQLSYNFPVPFKKLNKAEISLAYKHLKMYERIVEEDLPLSLILEDDVIFEEDFVNRFNINLHFTPRDWDMIFIGSGCDLRISPNLRHPGKVAYLKGHPASRCADSYIIKKSSAEKLLDTISPFSLPIDFELNYQMFLHDMNVYWWEPPIVKQGSQCGLFESTVQ